MQYIKLWARTWHRSHGLTHLRRLSAPPSPSDSTHLLLTQRTPSSTGLRAVPMRYMQPPLFLSPSAR